MAPHGIRSPAHGRTPKVAQARRANGGMSSRDTNRPRTRRTDAARNRDERPDSQRNRRRGRREIGLLSLAMTSMAITASVNSKKLRIFRICGVIPTASKWIPPILKPRAAAPRRPRPVAIPFKIPKFLVPVMLRMRKNMLNVFGFQFRSGERWGMGPTVPRANESRAMHLRFRTTAPTHSRTNAVATTTDPATAEEGNRGTGPAIDVFRPEESTRASPKAGPQASRPPVSRNSHDVRADFGRGSCDAKYVQSTSQADTTTAGTTHKSRPPDSAAPPLVESARALPAQMAKVINKMRIARGPYSTRKTSRIEISSARNRPLLGLNRTEKRRALSNSRAQVPMPI